MSQDQISQGPFAWKARRRLRPARRPGATAAVVLPALFQNPVHARVRGDVYALIGQTRHDLAGRKACELRCVAGGDDFVALRLAELVARGGPFGVRAT